MEHLTEMEKAQLYEAGRKAFEDSDFAESMIREIAAWELPDYDSDAYGRAFVLAAREYLASCRSNARGGCGGPHSLRERRRPGSS